MRDEVQKLKEADPSKQHLIRFEDDDLDNVSMDEELYIRSDDFLQQLEEFFQIKQSVVLLDLASLANLPLDSYSDADTNIRVELRKKLVIEETPVPEVSPALKALIDKNLLEIFKFYCKKHLN